MALSQNSSSSTPAQRGKCSVCGVWLCQWQEHDVCVIHYGIECTKGGSCPVCCEWTDTTIVVLASEPVGGRSRATELPCFTSRAGAVVLSKLLPIFPAFS